MSGSTSQAVEATYEGDVLRLHDPLSLKDQQRVLVLVVPVPESAPPVHEIPSPEKILNLAAQVYEGLSPQDLDEIEKIALDRRRFFAKLD